MLASRNPDRVSHLVLVATFVRSPVWYAASLAPLGPLLLRVSPPDWALKRMMLGESASKSDIDELRRLLKTIHPRVLAHRLAEVARVDVSLQLRSCKMPALYLRGSGDRLVRSGIASVLQDLKPDLRVQEIDGPHLLLQQQPTTSAAVIATFLHG